MATRYPVAYVRRSTADATDPGDVSREAQESAIRSLAHRDGHNGNLRVLVDWDKSADEAKESKRTAFLAMLAAIEAGEVSAVYAASLDRLYRSIRTFVRLTDAARKHDVRIVTAREGVLGGDGSPMAQAFAEITAVFAGLELRTAKARASGALAVRQQRGDHIGRVGYGYQLVRNAAGAIVAVPDPEHPLEPIVAAVREGGSILGGCKLLQARGIPAPDGGAVWGSTTLRRIIERAAPDLIPAVGPTGRRQPSRSSALAQLLVCGGRDENGDRCGHVLTPEPKRHAYRCRLGVRLGRDKHGLTHVTERVILPWVKAEAERVYQRIRDLEGDAVRQDAANDATRVRLEAKRSLILDTYLDGAFGEGAQAKAERDRRLAAVDEDLAAIVPVVTVRDLPPIDWSADPAKVNRILTSLFVSVDLGPDLRPIGARSRLPERYVR